MSLVIAGAAETSAKLSRLQQGLETLDGMAEVGRDLLTTARTVHRRTGTLAGRIRTQLGPNRVTLTGPAYRTWGITANQFIRNAGEAQADGAAARTLDRNIIRLVRDTGL